MRLFVLSLTALCASALVAQTPSGPPASVTGRWSIEIEYMGAPLYWPLTLTEDHGKLTGQLDTDKLTGTREGNHIHFRAQDPTPNGGFEEVDATLSGNVMTGTLGWAQNDDPKNPKPHPYKATFIPVRSPNQAPVTHEFKPTVFYRQFSALNAPVLHVLPGDTIRTTTVDAGGADEKGTARSRGGNPETGPFYIDGAMPGDTLVVHIKHLRLNRDYAISDDGIVPRALTPSLANQAKDTGNRLRWHLDLAKNVATTDRPGEHLKSFTVPLKPMLGCIATAVGAWAAAPPTGDSGEYGGNMDFNEITEGATVYLPVYNPGALLYFGDGHAAMGDGETTGDALETSMDVEVTVDVLSGVNTPAPRVENDTYIMAMGLSGSLDGALQQAADNMAQWLYRDYKLTASEFAQVFGTSAELKISEVADRNAGVVMKIRKDRLKTISTGATPKP